MWSAAVEGARFATMTEAGVLAKVGVSTRGIAVALNILYHASDGTGELGVPVHFVLRRLLEEAASTGDAWELLRETPYSASSCVTVVDADGEGACFELDRPGLRASSRATASSPTPITSWTTRWREARQNSPPRGCPARGAPATARRTAPRGLG